MSQEDSLLSSTDGGSVEHEGSVDTASTTPRPSLGLQAIVLLSICFLTFGGYWVYDTPGAISSNFKKWFLPKYHYDKDSTSLLYSVYSWPNVALAMCGGYVVDRITGVRLGMIMFCSFIWLGQLVFAIGIQAKLFDVCVAGRFIFGLGGECLAVVQNTFVVRWFSGPYLSLIFGLVLAFARIGSSVNFVLTPYFADNKGVPFAVWFGVGACTLSLISALVLAVVDYANRHYVEKAAAVKTQSADSSDQIIVPDEIGSSPTIQQDHSSLTPIDAPSESEAQPEDELPSLRQILDFPVEAWLLFGLCVCLYLGIFVFYQTASEMMQDINKYSESKASSILSTPNFVSIGASPFFGTIVDRKGKSLSFLLVATLGLICCHLLFLLNCYDVTNISPIPILVVFGVCYSLAAASLWPTLAFIVPKNLLATGYGAMTAIQNLGLAVIPLIIGKITTLRSIKKTRDEYGIPILIFIFFEFMAFTTAVYLRYRDACQTGILDASAVDRVRIRERLEEEAKAAKARQAEENLPHVHDIV